MFKACWLPLNTYSVFQIRVALRVILTIDFNVWVDNSLKRWSPVKIFRDTGSWYLSLLIFIFQPNRYLCVKNCFFVVQKSKKQKKKIIFKCSAGLKLLKSLIASRSSYNNAGCHRSGTMVMMSHCLSRKHTIHFVDQIDHTSPNCPLKNHLFLCEYEYFDRTISKSGSWFSFKQLWLIISIYPSNAHCMKYFSFKWAIKWILWEEP